MCSGILKIGVWSGWNGWKIRVFTIWGAIWGWDAEIWDFGWFSWRFWKLDFWVSGWKNLLYEFQKRQAAVLVFSTPYTLKHTLIVQYCGIFLLERLFDIIRSEQLEQNILERMFEYIFVSFQITTFMLKSIKKWSSLTTLDKKQH